MVDEKSKALILDFDGVVVDSEVIALAELQACLAEFGIELQLGEMISRFLGASFEDIEAFVHGATGRMPDASFREGWYARLFERYSRELRIMPGVLTILDRLDRREFPYCIASGSSYRRLDFALRAVDLSERFAGRAYSADSVEHGKPAPDLFLFAAMKMNARPEDCLVVEDAGAGVSAAIRAGMRVVGFVGGRHLTDHREEHAARLRTAGAADVVARFDDLLQIMDASS